MHTAAEMVQMMQQWVAASQRYVPSFVCLSSLLTLFFPPKYGFSWTLSVCHLTRYLVALGKRTQFMYAFVCIAAGWKRYITLPQLMLNLSSKLCNKFSAGPCVWRRSCEAWTLLRYVACWLASVVHLCGHKRFQQKIDARLEQSEAVSFIAQRPNSESSWLSHVGVWNVCAYLATPNTNTRDVSLHLQYT